MCDCLLTFYEIELMNSRVYNEKFHWIMVDEEIRADK